MAKGLTIGYTCNVRPPELEHDPKYGEWESRETIDAIIKAFEKTGNRVILIDADQDVYHKLLRLGREIDVVFNNAEGLKEMELREARVPFFCEELNLPYTGSGTQTLINAIDKPTTKEILGNYGINTPLFQRMDSYTARLEDTLRFPLMVKPIGEGTSIGISQDSRVETSEELERAVRRIIREYQQQALVEEFVEGEEYTVGIIERYILPILKIPISQLPENPVVRDPHVKNIENPFIKPMSYREAGYIDLARQTAVAFEALSCNDYCRMDFRKGKDGKFYFLEMNPLPGIHPTDADLTTMSTSAGLTHEEMINMMLWGAIKRIKEDKRYRASFAEEKLEGVRDLVKSAKARLSFYEREIPGEGNGNGSGNGNSYRLVKTSDRALQVA